MLINLSFCLVIFVNLPKCLEGVEFTISIMINWNCLYPKGIQTSQDAKFYGISSKLEKPFSNEGKPLVIQFTVKHEQNIDCGGGYIKLYPKDLDQKKLHGDSPYFVMFGK